MERLVTFIYPLKLNTLVGYSRFEHGTRLLLTSKLWCQHCECANKNALEICWEANCHKKFKHSSTERLFFLKSIRDISSESFKQKCNILTDWTDACHCINGSDAIMVHNELYSLY